MYSMIKLGPPAYHEVAQIMLVDPLKGWELESKQVGRHDDAEGNGSVADDIGDVGMREPSEYDQDGDGRVQQLARNLQRARENGALRTRQLV